ncbi:hypothetical protein [Rhizobium sp. C4]|uniref:hypothetical protein n=1 Tax=Rhizobium sp. C4 TaxID=1349800 RepID=UPI001E4CBC02|nr:hypothetical protein [Rhizobium sp. C4]MCD2174446.1 hypothetical protein [Rhizobium sp. C4]
MARLLKLSRIERKPKKVLESPHFDSPSYFRGKPHLAAHLADIYIAISKGEPLPPWAYRRDIDTTDDDLLERLGVMHLHLGSQSSAELLFLMQYEEHVIFLEIASHRHFETDPPGTLLRRLHERKVEEINETLRLEQEAAEAVARQRSETLKSHIRKILAPKDRSQ